MVASANALASRIGAEVLEAGGNAVDAAIATGFALAVTHPTAGNIGGGGFMVIRFPDGRATAIDFRERPRSPRTRRCSWTQHGEYSYESTTTATAVGVPGTVAGFELAHQSTADGVGGSSSSRPCGSRRGLRGDAGLARSLERVLPSMQRYPASCGLLEERRAVQAGELLRQPDLGATLGAHRDRPRRLLQGRDGATCSPRR